MLELKHISKQFQDRKIFSNLSVTFPDCGLIGIQGASGCGKSTLLYIIGMLDQDFTGEVYFDNEIILDKQSFISEHVSFMMQNKDYISALTIKENIVLACQVAHRFYTPAQLKKITKQLGINDLLHYYPYQLSGGQLKRVSLAKALLKQSSIILADEPTGALHHQQAIEVMSLLKKYAKDCLIVVVSHDPQLLKDYCDSVLTLKDGQLHGKIEHQTKDKHLPSKRFSSLVIYPIRQLLYQKQKLIFLCIFQWIIILAFFFMITGMNGIYDAICKSEEQCVYVNMMNVENKNGDPFETIIKDSSIKQSTYAYHLEQISIQSAKKDRQASLSFLPTQTNHIQLLKGRLPNKSHEVLVTQSFYQKLSQKQTLDFVYHQQRFQMTIVGVIQPTFFQGDEVYCMQDFQEYIPQLKDIYTLLVESFDQQSRPLSLKLSQNYLPYSEIHERIDSYQTLLTLAKGIAYLFITVSFMISLMMIRIVLSIVYYERQHDEAYLLSLGMDKRRFIVLSLLESLFLGIVIAVIADLLFAIVYEYVNHVIHIEQYYMFSLTLKPIWWSVYDLYIVIVIIYLLMSMLGTLKPLRSVMKTNMIDVLREE